MSWQIVFTRQARKDARRIAAAGLRPKAESLLTLLAENPFRRPPPFERLVGDLKGAYSRRINIQHRLVIESFHNGVFGSGHNPVAIAKRGARAEIHF